MMTKFGWWGHEMRGTPAADASVEVAVPAGENCHYCGTVVTEYDSGMTQPVTTEAGHIIAMHTHRMCLVYSVRGSRWCRAEGVEQKTLQHKRYHELQNASYGLMRPEAVERRVLLEFGEYTNGNHNTN